MLERLLARSAMLLALPLSFPALAADDVELARIRAELRQLKETYEARIRALEDRLRAAESATAAEGTKAATAATAPPRITAGSPRAAAATPGGSSGAAANAFNPAIGVTLQGTYARLSEDPASYRIAGFASAEDVGPAERGFSLAESELTFVANVDDKFAAQLTVSLAPDNSVEVEEAYGHLTALPYGLNPKVGRFFSGLGYLNEQHPHVWDFVDAPLVYQAFLGGNYRNDGVQLKWVAPTEQFLELGAELGNGSGFPGTRTEGNGVGSVVLYAHTGGDLGTSHSWRAGASWLHTRARDRGWTDVDAEGNPNQVAFSGESDVAVADFVWKYAPNGNPRQTHVKIQGEYFWRRERGEFTCDADGVLGLTLTDAYRSTQRGGYVQAVWQFVPAWRVGARYDRLDAGSPSYGANAGCVDASPFDPRRSTFMIDWSPSEFSRVRLQLARSQVQPGLTDNQLFLQYILSIGAHGAHRY